MMQPEVDDTVQALHRLAGQATAAGRALARIDDTALAADAERLLAARATASGDIAVQLDRSLASVRAQQEIHDRLVVARNGVLARLESGTLGLESLVARVIELSAMAVSGPAGELGAVDQLGDELEGIRQGLAETEEISRQALSAYQRNDPA
jgi:multidrug efflux pump subunit AcrA (membrane-fusion protein)